MKLNFGDKRLKDVTKLRIIKRPSGHYLVQAHINFNFWQAIIYGTSSRWVDVEDTAHPTVIFDIDAARSFLKAVVRVIYILNSTNAKFDFVVEEHEVSVVLP